MNTPPEKKPDLCLEGFHTEQVLLEGPGNEQIPVRIILPDPAAGRARRCVVVLYGIAQDLGFFDRIAPAFARHGFAMAMAEQYQCGERRQHGMSLWSKARALYQRTHRVVPETRLLVDYLSTRDDIDKDRLDFMGASYGAIMGCSVLAAEPRLRSGILVMAGGDFRKLFTSIVRKGKPESRFLWPAAAELMAWLGNAFEPLRHVGNIAPRPLLFLHVEDDEIIERTCAQALVAAAGEPKEEIWYPDVHDNINEETIQRMMHDGLSWLQKKTT